MEKKQHQFYLLNGSEFKWYAQLTEHSIIIIIIIVITLTKVSKTMQIIERKQ